jgi:TRAP-type mannitol/chloroaromatic compound transport system substrate-binding protein
MKKHIVLGLNEGQIMKAVLKYADEEGSYDMLRKISANRGTTIQVLLNEYDVSNIKEPSEVIKQNQDVKQEVKVE